MGELCGIIHDDKPFHTDATGCLLPEGHEGPHEHSDETGARWQWETDLSCDCWHCRRCEGDYCTVYWRKPRPAHLAQGKDGGHAE